VVARALKVNPHPVLCALMLAAAALSAGAAARQISWADTAPIRPFLQARGLSETTFPAFVDDFRTASVARVREGDLDHLVFYLLQSTRFTSLPPIEPAVSAKALVGGLDAGARETFLKTPHLAGADVPADVRARIAALRRTVEERSPDARLAYFHGLIESAFPEREDREVRLGREYLRVMRFVYQKEFGGAGATAPDVASLYRDRGLSTDTAVEAGYLVSIGLGIAHGLDPAFRVRRALIVGPGLDLAPRTGLQEEGPPESYQPWAVMDALVSLGLGRVGELEIVAADINPRVVAHLRRARETPPALTLVTGIGDSATVHLSDEYRAYFGALGTSIGTAERLPARLARSQSFLRRAVQVSPAAARALRAEPLDVVTERLDERAFDLVIATNILPYFDDVELALALTNVAAMLRPGGVFLHNEPRPVIGELSTALGMPFVQSRYATIAIVAGAQPLSDSVWLHRRQLPGEP
jgi:SAM-dependent methyltransferase